MIINGMNDAVPPWGLKKKNNRLVYYIMKQSIVGKPAMDEETNRQTDKPTGSHDSIRVFRTGLSISTEKFY